MFTNQWRMSALQCVPSEMRDHFPLLCVLKSHYAITLLLAPLVFIVKYGCEKPGNITTDYFPSCCGTPFFFFLFLFPCPGSQGLFSKLRHFKSAPVYKWLISPSPKQHSKRLCHVNTLYMSLHEIQPDMKRQLLHFASCGVNVAMEIFHVRTSLSLSASSSLWQV